VAPPTAVRWSVVIPAYNEANRLPRYLREVVGYFDGRDQPYEVLVMDDGSTDDTAVRVREERAAHPAVRLLSLGTNQGKGAAVRAGMLQATGTLRLMTDADGATPIGELKRLEAAIQGGADLAVASRALHDPSVVVRARLFRRLSGRVFIAAARALGVRQVVDTQCGFKLFRGAVADELFGALRTNGFGFDVELVLRAERRGYRIAEIPVNWTDQPGSKVGVFSDGPRMLAQIVAARMRLSGEAGKGTR
jgi:dolichyl-phosphate beta-glucosyltransferase